MIIPLLGVVEVAGIRAPGVPLFNAQPLSFPRGANVTFELRVKYSTGELIDLTQAGLSLVFAVKQHTNDPVAVLSLGALVLPAKGRGYAEMYLDANTLLCFSPTKYVYDVWVLWPSGEKDSIVPLSPLFLAPGATFD